MDLSKIVLQGSILQTERQGSSVGLIAPRGRGVQTVLGVSIFLIGSILSIFYKVSSRNL